MNAISLQVRPWLEAHTAKTTEEARRDVLVVCGDRTAREAYVELFDRRGLNVGEVSDCRTAIASQAASGARLAIIIASREDPYTGALIHSLWEREPKPSIWLIADPSVLRLTEVIAQHEVAVLPESTTPQRLERTLFALEAAKPNPNGISVPRMLTQRPAQQEKYVEDFHRAKWEFERRFILRALQCYHGNVCRTAKAIGLQRRSLQVKLRSLEIDTQSTRV